MQAGVNDWSVSPITGEDGELVLVIDGHELTVATRMWTWEWSRLVRGGTHVVTLELQRGPGEITLDRRGPAAGIPDPGLDVPVDRCRYRLAGPVARIDHTVRLTPGRRDEFVQVWVDVGLPQPVDFGQYLPDEVEGLMPGEIVASDGFLHAWLVGYGQ